MTAISALADGTTSPRQQPERRNGNARFLQTIDLVVVVCVVGLIQFLRFGGEPATQTGHNSLGYSVVFSRIVGIWMSFVAVCRTRVSRIVGVGHGERFWRNVSC